MILNYTEASAYATEIAKYLLLASMGTMIFCWAWTNIISYFHLFFEPSSDLDDVVDAIIDLKDTVESQSDEPRPLEIVV